MCLLSSHRCYAIVKASKRYLNVDAFVIGKGIRTGMRTCTDNPQQLGADRIINAVAAYKRYAQRGGH